MKSVIYVCVCVSVKIRREECYVCVCVSVKIGREECHVCVCMCVCVCVKIGREECCVCVGLSACVTQTNLPYASYRSREVVTYIIKKKGKILHNVHLKYDNRNESFTFMMQN